MNNNERFGEVRLVLIIFCFCIALSFGFAIFKIEIARPLGYGFIGAGVWEYIRKWNRREV